MAVKLGVDAVGFIFAPSQRRIEPEKARAIISLLPPFLHTVGVFVNETPAVIRRIVEYCGIDLVQLHGDETPDTCVELMPRSIKAFQIRDESSLQSAESYSKKVRAFLFDAYSKEKRGGTGNTFDWDLAIRGKELGMPVILSGGLNPSNIESAIAAVRPYAVDVNSGVEEGPGRKSPILLEKLMKIVSGMDMGGLTS